MLIYSLFIKWKAIFKSLLKCIRRSKSPSCLTIIKIYWGTLIFPVLLKVVATTTKSSHWKYNGNYFQENLKKNHCFTIFKIWKSSTHPCSIFLSYSLRRIIKFSSRIFQRIPKYKKLKL